MIKNFHKIEEHQNKSFPVSFYSFTNSPTKYIVGPHFQDSFEIFYIKQGRITVEIDDRTFIAEEDDIYFINMCQVHAASSLNSDGLQLNVIVFDTQILDNLNLNKYFTHYITPFISGETRFPNKLQKNTPLFEHIKASLDLIIHENSEQKVGYEVFIKTEIERLFTLFFRYKHHLDTMDTSYLSPLDKALLEQVIQHIHTNYQTNITLDDISDVLHMNKHYFCRKIKKLTGKSFTQLLNMYRIQHAENLLRSSSLSVSIISQTVGFSNLSYFNRVFLNHIGMTPSQFRKLNNHSL